MNAVMLEGRLATPVTSKEYPRSDGKGTNAKSSFLMAVPKFKRDAEPEWVRVECWARLAEVVAEHLTKGTRVTVRGRISGRFLDKEGAKRGGTLRTVVVAEEVIFGQRPKGTTEDTAKGGRR